MHCVSAFVCLREGTQFQRQRLTLSEGDGLENRKMKADERMAAEVRVTEGDGGAEGGMNDCDC